MTQPICDFEGMMVKGIVYGYAAHLAEAWLNNDLAEIARITKHIEGNYGASALKRVGELAVELAAQS
jgi:hypothetical protein